MIPPPIPLDEDARIAALKESGWTHLDVDLTFTKWLEDVAASLDLPMVCVSLVDRRQQIPIASAGFRARHCSREASLDGYVILDHDPLIVPDALKDERFADNPFVSGPPFIRFYAGTALITQSGKMVGALAGLDTRPRNFPEAFFPQLQDAAAEAVRRLDAFAVRPQMPVSTSATTPVEVAEVSPTPTLLNSIANGKARDRLFFEEFLSQYFKESQRLLHALERPKDTLTATRACQDLRELALHAEFTELTSLCRAWESDLRSKSPRRSIYIQAMRQAWDSGVRSVREIRQEAPEPDRPVSEDPDGCRVTG